MAITFRSYGTGAGSGGSASITKPSGLALNDLMLANVITHNGSISSDGTWTQIYNDVNTYYFALFYKVAVQADVDATNFAFTGGTSLIRGIVSAYIGVDTTSPISDKNHNTGSGTSLTTTGFVQSNASEMIILFASLYKLNGASTYNPYTLTNSDPGLVQDTYF